jgi:hypothetical protein
MEKSDYVEKAPLYYALGIAFTLLRTGAGYSSLRQLSEVLDPSHPPLFDRSLLAEKATAVLKKAGAVDVMEDDFGPTLYAATDTLRTWIDSAPYAPFVKFHAAGYSTAWIVEAIETVNFAYNQHGLTPDDFEGPDERAQWEPLPLDRSDPILISAQEALETAIGQIEADNGYAVHAPGERSYVLSSLKAVGKALKEEGQITAMYVKTFALEPLARVVARFGPGAVGVVAAAARAALTDWLKSMLTKMFTG